LRGSREDLPIRAFSRSTSLVSFSNFSNTHAPCTSSFSCFFSFAPACCRADRKLFLDAAVIQQGGLAEQNNNLSKNELMAMVRFGADEIFKGKGATWSDKDIDTILSDGEARTAEQQALIQKDAQHSLADFTLMAEPEGGSVFDFEGQDFRDKHGGGLFLNLPQRERKRNYDVNVRGHPRKPNLVAALVPLRHYRSKGVDFRARGWVVAWQEYFRDALTGGGPKEKLPKARKGPPMHDFQFFQRDKLEALLQRE